MSSKVEWNIAYIDSQHRKEIESQYKSNTALTKRWGDFVRDVTGNPHYHPKQRRIAKLKDKKAFPPGTWRYRNEPIRVVYFPKSSTKEIFPLEVSTADKVSYKKRSSK